LITAEDGRSVAYLKRVRNGGKIGVMISYPGSLYWPTSRNGQAKPFKLSGPQAYSEREAKRWLGTLERAGFTGFKITEAA
jgi:hypothetical protein